MWNSDYQRYQQDSSYLQGFCINNDDNCFFMYYAAEKAAFLTYSFYSYYWSAPYQPTIYDLHYIHEHDTEGFSEFYFV